MGRAISTISTPTAPAPWPTPASREAELVEPTVGPTPKPGAPSDAVVATEASLDVGSGRGTLVAARVASNGWVAMKASTSSAVGRSLGSGFSICCTKPDGRKNKTQRTNSYRQKGTNDKRIKTTQDPQRSHDRRTDDVTWQVRLPTSQEFASTPFQNVVKQRVATASF